MARKAGLRSGLALAWMLAKQDIRNRYASSYAGVAWTIGVPLLYAVINVVVFSILMNGRMGVRYGDIPFALFYFLPFSLWIFFADTVNRSTVVLREYGYLINKIAFPFWVLPLVPVLSAFISQAIILVIVAALMMHLNVSLADTAYLYVLVWATCVVLALGIAYGMSALAVYIPDLAQIVPVVVNILFWLTPILYPATLVEDHGALWVRGVIMDYNPFYYLVEISRHAVFGTGDIMWQALLTVFGVAVVVLVGGVCLFRKLKSGFADVI
jgi:ABC-type polysaccharide/polyol phosphate export permease